MPIDNPPAIVQVQLKKIDSRSGTIGTTSFYSFKRPTNIIISGPGEALVTINTTDGSITYGPHYKPDKAARVFWESLSQEYRVFLAWKAAHPDGK